MAPAWERIAGDAGGTVGGLATVTVAGRSVVFAATSVGVYHSLDGGRTWLLPGVHNTVPFAEMVAPSVDFEADRTLFVCAADGLYRSSDGGEAWQPVLVGSRMLGVATARAGLVLAATETDGVLRSEDAGRTWQGANAGLVELTVLALALSPEFGTDRTGFAGTASGLYRTRNGARSWRSVDMDLAEPAVQCVAMSPGFAADRLVLAGTEADGLLRSDDAGATWHQPADLVDQGVTALAFSSRYPRTPTIAAAVESGIALSDDGGQTWRLTDEPPPGLVLSLSFVATDDGEALLAGLHRQGVARSDDGGAHWQRSNDGLNARLLTGLVLSPAFAEDQTLFAIGPQDGVSVSTDGGRSWLERNDGLTDAALALAVSDTTLYVATQAGIHVSRDGAATWQLAPGASGPARTVAAVPGSGTVVAALAGGGLLASDDAGITWRTLPASFDGAEIGLLALAPDGTIFVATASADIVLWRSSDGGGRWERSVVEREVGADTFIALAVSPNYAHDELVFLGRRARVFRPSRPGADLGGGLATVTALALSPKFADDRTVFVATSAGMFVSRDAGDTYQAWSEGLDPPRMVGLAISPNYPADRLVYGLGLGGTIWRRQDHITAAGSGESRR